MTGSLSFDGKSVQLTNDFRWKGDKRTVTMLNKYVPNTEPRSPSLGHYGVAMLKDAKELLESEGYTVVLTISPETYDSDPIPEGVVS